MTKIPDSKEKGKVKLTSINSINMRNQVRCDRKIHGPSQKKRGILKREIENRGETKERRGTGRHVYINHK